MAKAQVILFKESGKYYTEEEWEIPEDAIGPYDMERSPNFRRIGNGAVLVVTQEPWGYPALFPSPAKEASLTDAELNAISMTARLWDSLVQDIVANGPTREQDLAELASLIHGIQAKIMGQAAARAYPSLYRLLGSTL